MSELRAPVADGAILAEPPLGDAERLLSANEGIFQQSSLALFGVPLAEIRANLRGTAIFLASAYLSAEGFILPKTLPSRLIVSGHQPELFHPGVWAKNFAIQGLARRNGAAALNLIIDNDAPKSSFLRIPVIDPENPHWRRLPFDRWLPGLAYEECPVQDETVFAKFAARAEPIITNWNFSSMLPKFWRHVVQAESPLLGDRIAAARRVTEREWGCRNLELPMRLLCQTDEFRMFAAHIFANLPLFHESYNAVLDEYRKRHGLSSRNHPVPNLLRDGSWLETPFWVWRSGEPRQRLWACVSPTEIALRGETIAMPSLTVDSKSRLRKSWTQLEVQDFKIRTRALTTTLFARLFLADLFVHGIGGAKYDEVTDELIRRFYQTEPPRFMILSATLRLPFPRADVSNNDCRQLTKRQRDLYWNPQRHVNSPSVGSLIKEKLWWIDKPCTTKHERRTRYRKLRDITDKLRTYVQQQIETTRTQAQRCASLVKANEILGRRDYAFCLYPEDEMRALCESVMA